MKRLLDMQPDSMLHDDPKNVEFPYDKLVKAIITKPRLFSKPKFEIEAAEWKKFTLETGKSYKAALRLCTEHIPNLLKIK